MKKALGIVLGLSLLAGAAISLADDKGKGHEDEKHDKADKGKGKDKGKGH